MEMERYYYITLSTCVSEGLGCRWRWAEGLGGAAMRGAWGSLRTGFGGGGFRQAYREWWKRLVE